MRRIIQFVIIFESLLFFTLVLIPFSYFILKSQVLTSDFSILLGWIDHSVVMAIKNSILVSLSVGLLSTSTSFIISWLLWRYSWNKKLKRFIELWLKIPYLVPPFFFAMGWIILLAPQVGYLRILFFNLFGIELPTIYGIAGTVFVLWLWCSALAMIQLQSFFGQFSGQLEDAALMCGASPIKSFFKITLPLAKNYLMGVFLITSLNALSAFGVPWLLASTDRKYVLTTKIYQAIKSESGFGKASLLSLVLLVLTLVILIAQSFIEKNTKKLSLVTGKPQRPAQMKPKLVQKLMVLGVILFLLCSSILPLSAIFILSILNDRLNLYSVTLERYRYVFFDVPDVLIALKNSILISGVVSGFTVLFAIIFVYGVHRRRSRLGLLTFKFWNLAYATPGTIIALFLLVFFSDSLANTLIIFGIAYFIKYNAYALRTLFPAVAALGRDLEEASWMSGANEFTTFKKIVLPILSQALSSSFILLLIPMLSELTMSVFLVGPGLETLGTLIYRFLEYSDPSAAAVCATLLVVIIIVLNTLIRIRSKGRYGI